MQPLENCSRQTNMGAASGKLFPNCVPPLFLLRCPYSLHVRAALSCQVVAQLNDFLAKQLSKKFEPVQVGHVVSCRVVSCVWYCQLLPTSVKTVACWCTHAASPANRPWERRCGGVWRCLQPQACICCFQNDITTSGPSTGWLGWLGCRNGCDSPTTHIQIGVVTKKHTYVLFDVAFLPRRPCLTRPAPPCLRCSTVRLPTALEDSRSCRESWASRRQVRQSPSGGGAPTLNPNRYHPPGYQQAVACMPIWICKAFQSAAI